MKSDVETLSPTRVKLTVDLPFEELAPQPGRRLQAHRRAGHRSRASARARCPPRVIDQRFGRGAGARGGGQRGASPRPSTTAVKENDLKPLGQPGLRRPGAQRRREPRRSRSRSTCAPSSTCRTSTPSRVEVDSAEPTDEEVAEQLDALRARFATLTDVERPAQDGDVLLVDLAGDLRGRDGRGPHRHRPELRGRRHRGADPGLRRGRARRRRPTRSAPSASRPRRGSTRARTSTSR